MKRSLITACSAALLLAASPLAAAQPGEAAAHFLAKKGGNGHGNGHDKGHGNPHGQPGPAVDNPEHGNGHERGVGRGTPPLRVEDNDRTVIVNYFGREFAEGRCPPGLAKKDNGCLPPGQAKRYWVNGDRVPSSIAYYPLPDPLLGTLSAAPIGYGYIRVGPDILLVERSTMIVVDAFPLY